MEVFEIALDSAVSDASVTKAISGVILTRRRLNLRRVGFRLAKNKVTNIVKISNISKPRQ